MKRAVHLMFMIVLSDAVISLAPGAQSLEITDFFSIANRCDYLIITPQVFQEGSSRLALYRTGYQGDDVSAAGFVVFEKLLSQFPRTGAAPDTILRESIAWACNNWALRPQYIVFIGDDSVKTIAGDSIPRNRGPMPTHIFKTIERIDPGDGIFRFDTTFSYSDDWFCKLCTDNCIDTSDPFRYTCGIPYQCKDSPLSFGRIPCEQPAELDGYLQKVQKYGAMGTSPWRNRVLLLTDDRYQNGIPDPVDHASFSYVTISHLSGRFIRPLFLDDFIRNGYPGLDAAKESFFTHVNNGAEWTVFFGHANPSALTYEGMVRADDYAGFRNADMPTIVFSFGCANGAFYNPKSASMCKRFLFMDGGAVAYIASPNTTGPGSVFLNRILQIRDSLPGLSLGRLAALATRGEYFSPRSYEILGDPALRGGMRCMPLSIQRDAGGAVICSTVPEKMGSAALFWEITQGRQWYDTLFQSRERRDSVIFSGTDTLVEGLCRIAIPSLPKNDLLKITVFAWNDSFESRGAMHFFGNVQSTAIISRSCSFVPQIIWAPYQYLEKTVVADDSLVMSVVGRNSIVQWRRDALSFASGRSLVRLGDPDTQSIEAFAPSPDGAIVFANVNKDIFETWTRTTFRKINVTGHMLWSFYDSTMSAIRMRGITSMHDGGCLAWGSIDSASSYCIRLNKAGALMWRATLRTAVHDMTEASRGECMFTGSGFGDSVSSKESLRFGRIDSTGNMLWEKKFLKDSSACGNALYPGNDDRWIIAGTTAAGGQSNIWVLFLNPAGDTLWSRSVENASAISLLVTSSGIIAVSGCTGMDGIVATFDQQGNPRYSMSVSGNRVRLLSSDSGGFRFLAALYTSKDALQWSDTQYYNGSLGESIGILSVDGTSANRHPPDATKMPKTRLSAVVLPSRALQFTLGSPQTTAALIDLFDVLGKRLAVVTVPPNASRVLWKSRRIAPGTYIARLRANTVTTDIVCIHGQ